MTLRYARPTVKIQASIYKNQQQNPADQWILCALPVLQKNLQLQLPVVLGKLNSPQTCKSGCSDGLLVAVLKEFAAYLMEPLAMRFNRLIKEILAEDCSDSSK